MYVTNINNTRFSPKRTRCRYLNIITTVIAKAGAKSETEIIALSTNFSFVSYDNHMGQYQLLSVLAARLSPLNNDHTSNLPVEICGINYTGKYTNL